MYPVHSTTVSSLLFFVILCLLNVNLVQSDTADFLQSENNTTTLNSPITFVWVNLILVSGTVGFVLIPMFYLAFKHMSEIVKTHSTISSYCADPISNTHANRGLLAATCLFGSCLCGLLVEEYNSRSDADYRFYFELAAAALLPLVGICPTGGAGTQQIKYWIAIKGGFKVPIEYSTAIHSLAALYFMIANTILNMSYTTFLISKDISKGKPHTGATIVVFLFSIASCLVLAGFLVTQAVIFFKAYVRDLQLKNGVRLSDASPLVQKGGSSAQLTTIEPESNSDRVVDADGYVCQVCGCTHKKQLCSDCGTITDSQVHGHYYQETWRWYLASFMFEMFVVLFVLITSALCSIKRNNMFPYIK